MDRRVSLPTFLLKAGGSLILLAVVFWIVDVEVVISALRNLDLRLWGLTVLMHAGLHVLQATKWRLFLDASGVDLPLSSALRFHAAGLFASLGLPSLIGGDVLRVALATRQTGKPEAVTLGSIADRLSDILGIVVLVSGGLILAPSAIQGQALDLFVLVLASVAILTVAAFVTLRFVLRAKFLRRIPRRAAQSALRARRGLQTMARSPGRALLGLGLSLFFQAGIVITAIPIGAMLGFYLDVRLWFLCYPLAKAMTMLPISLGGIGVLEASFQFLVEAVADGKLAVALALVMQSIRIALGLLAGVAWFCMDLFHSGVQKAAVSRRL